MNKPIRNCEKPNGPAQLGKRGKFAFSLFAVTLLAGTVTVTAFADGDPLAVVSNLSDFIFSLIRAVGLILLGWGVVQVGLSFQSLDPPNAPRAFSLWRAVWSSPLPRRFWI